MILPNCERAYITDRKLTGYLLSESHATGRAKAKYFRSLGYSKANFTQLQQDLLVIAKSERITQKIINPFGTKYVIEGKLVTPSGTMGRVCTVWMIESDDNRPRFVTAYPAG